MGAGPVGFVTPRKEHSTPRAQARHPGIGRCRLFPGASLLRRSGSLLGRLNSLIGRLGNSPLVFWKNNGLVVRVRSLNGPKSSFCRFFPAAQGLAGSRELRDRPSVPPGRNPRPGANSRQRRPIPTFAAPGQKPRSVAKAAASVRARRSVPSRKIDSAPIAVVA